MKLTHSRTFWVAVVTFAVGVLSLVSSSFGSYLSPEVAGIILTVLGLLNAFLRTITSKEITSVI